MKIPDLSRYALRICAGIAILAGCNAGGSQVAPAAGPTQQSADTQLVPPKFLIARRQGFPAVCPPLLTVNPPNAEVKPRQRVALQAILDHRVPFFRGCLVKSHKPVPAKWTTSGGHLLSYPSQLLVDFWAQNPASYQIGATYRSRSASAVVTVIGNCPSWPGGAGLLPDGDFSREWGATVGGIGSGKMFAPHWTSGGPQTIDFIGYVGGPWHGPKGVCSVDLDGTPGPGSIVHDTVPTKVHRSYILKFHFSGNGACGSMVQRMVVQAGSQSATYTWDTKHYNDAQHGQWLQETFTFNALGTSVTPSFTSADPSGGNCGPVVAAITMSRN